MTGFHSKLCDLAKFPNPDPAKLNQARYGWLYNHSQTINNNKQDQRSRVSDPKLISCQKI